MSENHKTKQRPDRPVQVDHDLSVRSNLELRRRHGVAVVGRLVVGGDGHGRGVHRVHRAAADQGLRVLLGLLPPVHKEFFGCKPTLGGNKQGWRNAVAR